MWYITKKCTYGSDKVTGEPPVDNDFKEDKMKGCKPGAQQQAYGDNDMEARKNKGKVT